jgi:hypothetical protein
VVTTEINVLIEQYEVLLQYSSTLGYRYTPRKPKLGAYHGQRTFLHFVHRLTVIRPSVS